MPQAVIDRVNQLGKLDSQPELLTFFDRNGDEIGDMPTHSPTIGTVDGQDTDHIDDDVEPPANKDVQVTEKTEQGIWVVRVPIPSHLIADGVQTFLISDKRSGETLDSFALMSGDALSYDIRAEVTLLREELDMLKRAFRRHCLETM